MNKRPVLILGGASDIGLAVAKRFAKEGYPIQLAARRPDELQAEQSDIALRHNVSVTLQRLDILETDGVEAFYDQLPETPGIVVCAVGLLGDQSQAERDPDHARLLVDTNFLGPAFYIEEAARRLSTLDDKAAIVGITSVAGDRGRAKNYWYGSAKSAFEIILSGLRQKYKHSNIVIVTIKPGFVRTKMSAAESFPNILVISPDSLASSIFSSLKRSRYVSYGSIRWALIAFTLKAIPEKIFRLLNF